LFILAYQPSLRRGTDFLNQPSTLKHYPSSFLLCKFLVVSFIFLTCHASHAQPVHTQGYVSIGGLDQWITISGEDYSKPVILFLHGGPGSVLSPYSESIYGAWNKDFILVNWDQRGAGRTFGLDLHSQDPEEYWLSHPLTIEQMVEDGIALVQYLNERLGKQKVILVGSSWGTILGTKMALKNPELFHAYLGHAQFGNYEKNLISAYTTTLEQAQQENDSTALQTLQSLGVPPYNDARSLGQMLRIVKEYESKHVPYKFSDWIISEKYDNEEDRQARYHGDDYSFLYFAGHEKLGIESTAKDVDFISDDLEFGMPVYLIQGEHDILTSLEISKEFFDKLKAPEKEYHTLYDAAHGFTHSVIDKQYEILKRLVVVE
jgi:pimeloyl-ACP methyl ester carboxylesterase